MKYIKLMLLLIVTSILFSSCYEQTYWLDENSTSDGNYYPVIQKVIAEGANDAIAEGDEVSITTLYWSKDDIKELQLWANVVGTDGLVTTVAHSESFDAESNAQKNVMSYTVPTGTSGSEIILTIKVVNNNGLEIEKSSTISIE